MIKNRLITAKTPELPWIDNGIQLQVADSFPGFSKDTMYNITGGCGAIGSLFYRVENNKVDIYAVERYVSRTTSKSAAGHEYKSVVTIAREMTGEQTFSGRMYASESFAKGSIPEVSKFSDNISVEGVSLRKLKATNYNDAIFEAEKDENIEEPGKRFIDKSQDNQDNQDNQNNPE